MMNCLRCGMPIITTQANPHPGSHLVQYRCEVCSVREKIETVTKKRTKKPSDFNNNKGDKQS